MKRPPARNDLCTCTSRDYTSSFLIDIVLSFRLLPFRKEDLTRKNRGSPCLPDESSFSKNFFIYFFFPFPLLHRVVPCFPFLVSFGEKVSCIAIYKMNRKV